VLEEPVKRCELFVAAKIEIGRVEPQVKDAAGLLRAPQPSAQLGTRDCWQHEPTRAVAPHQQHRFRDVDQLAEPLSARALRRNGKELVYQVGGLAGAPPEMPPHGFNPANVGRVENLETDLSKKIEIAGSAARKHERLKREPVRAVDGPSEFEIGARICSAG